MNDIQNFQNEKYILHARRQQTVSELGRARKVTRALLQTRSFPSCKDREPFFL